MVHSSLPGCIAFTMWRTYLEFRFWHSHYKRQQKQQPRVKWSGFSFFFVSVHWLNISFPFPLSRYHRQTVDHEHGTTTLSYRPGYASDLFLRTPKTGGLIKEYCKSLSRHLSSSTLLGLVSDYEAEFNNTPPPWPETFCLPEREYTRYGLLVGAWAIDHFN